MKRKIISLIILLSFLLCGCGKWKDVGRKNEPMLNENGKEEIIFSHVFADIFIVTRMYHFS